MDTSDLHEVDDFFRHNSFSNRQGLGELVWTGDLPRQGERIMGSAHPEVFSGENGLKLGFQLGEIGRYVYIEDGANALLVAPYCQIRCANRFARRSEGRRVG